MDTKKIYDNIKQFDVIKIDSKQKLDLFVIETLLQTEAPETLSFDIDNKESREKFLDEMKYNHTYKFLVNFFNKLEQFIIIVEYDYIDRTYRDSYYEYYAFKYHEYERNCIRLCIFEIELDKELRNKYFVNVETKILQKYFIGSMVIRPIPERAIGHTMINPKYVLLDKEELKGSKKDKNYFLRTSLFRINLCGHKLYVRAFPFSMQDLATTTCAETMLIGLMEYYNNEYSDYSRLYPSDIKQIAKESGYERTLPSKGLTYEMISKILTCVGFEPRCVLASTKTRISRFDLKRIMHYYIESGIPIGVGITISENSLHTCTCIGHGKINYDRLNESVVKELDLENGNELYFIDSESLVDEYIFVDDNRLPYSISEYSSRNNDENGKYSLDVQNQNLKALNIPLYKKMCLTLENAKEIFMFYLSNREHGIKKYLGENLGSENNPFVIRMFICSAKSFKASRLSDFKNTPTCQAIYANLKLPKFIEVCEIYDKKDYKDGKVSGEILLDATASSSDKALSLILINYGGQMIVMDNIDNSTLLLLNNKKSIDSKSEVIKFPSYKKNLMNVYDISNDIIKVVKK